MSWGGIETWARIRMSKGGCRNIPRWLPEPEPSWLSVSYKLSIQNQNSCEFEIRCMQEEKEEEQVSSKGHTTFWSEHVVRSEHYKVAVRTRCALCQRDSYKQSSEHEHTSACSSFVPRKRLQLSLSGEHAGDAIDIKIIHRRGEIRFFN